MKNINDSGENTSPFHIGEQTIQACVDKREQMEEFGQRVIRDFMPDQHRDFFANLPFLVVGSVDAQGWPWASLLPGAPGFVTSPDSNTLQINNCALQGDPLTDSIKLGSPLGLLGIDLAARRRNRLNARIKEVSEKGFSVSVDQSFGNCPQYIQARTVDFIDEVHDARQKHNEVLHLTTLDASAKKMITTADTFFVSSYVNAVDRPDIQGVDVSHRGGQPGFIKINGDTLTIPDYSGNYHFNTLGNFLCNPKAGLIFTDFETGDLLMLTGTVELLWEDEPEVIAFKGAERAWRFTLDHGLRLKQALPFRSTFKDYSPNTLMTGNWSDAAAIQAAEEKRNAWRSFRVARIEDESSVIRSFYFEPTDGSGLLPFQAGQFLTIRILPDTTQQPTIRTYTISSTPFDDFYRISVKRETDGQVSNYLHNALKSGDVIEARAPSGEFFIDPLETRPAVLIAGGVGITPMVSMAQHIVNEGQRTRHSRSLTVLHSAKTTIQRAFGDKFRHLQEQSGGLVRYYSFISQPANDDKPGLDFNATGRITEDSLRQILTLDDYDFYLCGPGEFMQALYNSLRCLGVRDARIYAEAFGPASLTRHTDEGTAVVKVPEADQAIIKFTESGFEQRWSAGDATILEVAESHGLTPDFGCRNGVCGTCTRKLISGSVAYRTKPAMDPDTDEVLICCAVPARGTATLEIAL